ncbi:flavin reductase family protein [Rhodococcus sp. BH5]|uniref:flavin reductase family protein n=1 Tax=Rhodococcus sp. BH5 TaxID=2871702 RepID=UPI0022CDA25C|nr:iron-sulfur cluster-binding domain-containing protein [Rhodococcus sp. BH5]MCZ9634924.1 iron-sulfur cluster-binding domain-containing protein [Rhodococcus sp. BH5]
MTSDFYKIAINSQARLTFDAVSITFTIPDRLKEIFSYRPGQHVIIRHRNISAETCQEIDRAPHRELRSSYYVCPPPLSSAEFRLIIRHIGNGESSKYSMRELRDGDTVEMSPPVGDFGLIEKPGAHHFFLTTNIGIAPSLSMAWSALRGDPKSHVSLIYFDRNVSDTLLGDEVCDLKDAYIDRCSVLHLPFWGSVDFSETIIYRDLSMLLELLDSTPDAETFFYIYAPKNLTENIVESLRDLGAAQDQLFFEIPTELDQSEFSAPKIADGNRKISMLLTGRTATVLMEPRDKTVLDALLRVRPDTPYSCGRGLCGACRTRIVSGSFSLIKVQHVLDDQDLIDGYTLACCAYPISDEAALDFDDI